MNVKEEALTLITEKRSLLIKNDFECTDVVKKNYNYEITVSDGNSNIKIQVYFGKKGIKTVYQGNTTSLLYQRIMNLFNGTDQPVSESDEVTEPEIYIGSDESGKGDFFGPLVVTAFYCDKKIKNKLLSLKIKDSKKLSDNKISVLYNNIGEDLDKYFVCRVVEPEEYNDLYAKYNNLNTLLNDLHSDVISRLLKKFKKTPEIVVDKFSEQKLKLPAELSPEITYIHKGERYIAVAAASVVARHRFNEWFRRDDVFDFGLLKGASADVTKKGAELKILLGRDALKKYAKLHFKIYNKL